MFDLGWTELLLIGIVALIVVGPKDLPMLFRKVGQFVGKAKGMAREFSRAMDQAADDAGVKSISKTISAATNPVKSSIDGLKTAAQDFNSVAPGSEAEKLSKERADAAAKIEKATAEKAKARLAAEAAAEVSEPKPEDLRVDAKTQDTVAEAKGEA
jgi:sec-independent protein translocase protein TatB